MEEKNSTEQSREQADSTQAGRYDGQSETVNIDLDDAVAFLGNDSEDETDE